MSSEQIWQRLFPYGNSIGNPMMHLTGNLNYYIGRQIAGTGYRRHRNLEFRYGQTQKRTLKAFDEAIVMVVRTVSEQSNDDWSAPYQVERADASTRFAQILICAGHAYHHAGQIIYLQKELLRGR